MRHVNPSGVHTSLSKVAFKGRIFARKICHEHAAHCITLQLCACRTDAGSCCHFYVLRRILTVVTAHISIFHLVDILTSKILTQVLTSAGIKLNKLCYALLDVPSIDSNVGIVIEQ